MLFLITVSCMIITVQSQNNDLNEELSRTAVQDSAFAELIDTAEIIMEGPMYIPESLDMNIDSLMSNWHFNYHESRNTGQFDAYNPVVSDSVYIERLRQLPRVFPMKFNDVVRSCISLYADRRRDLVEYMLGWADFYFPMIEEALDRNDLPLELKYLAVVESALNPVALSKAGASGLWQFMLPTGKIYGLEINSLVDERRDPVKSTYAACKYFKDMYAIYNDWNLVIAAYNCGPGNVNKAIKRSKGKTDFWEIYQYLPRETRTYVPLFIAANYVMTYSREHNLYPIEISLPLSTDTIMINKEIHFDQIVEILKIEKEQLRALNPQYKRDIIPGHSKPYALNLPAVYAYGFAELEDTIALHRVDELFANRVAFDTYNEKISYKVKSGESVLSIANFHGVTAAQVRKWNGLRSNKVAAGKTLVLYVNNGGYSLASNKSSSSSDKSSSNQTSATKSTNSNPSKNIASSNSSSSSYKVKSGDSYYSIAKKYPGVSANDIMNMNNAKNSSLRPGQVIKVP